jgi:Family of unknown function (DUF5723)
MGRFTSMGGRKSRLCLVVLAQAFICALAFPLFAQRNLTIYQLHANAQNYNLNPGRIPLNRINIGLPLLSNLGGNLSSSGFRWGDFQRDTTPEGLTRNPIKNFLDILDQDNLVYADATVNLLDLGMRLGKKNYVQLYAADQASVQFSYPRTLAEMLFNVGENKQVARTYDIQSLRMSGLHFRSYGLGFSHQFNPKFSAGLRAKYLQGISNIQSYNDSMRFTSDKDDRYFGVLGNLSFYGSGLAMYRNSKSLFIPSQGNSGFSFDLGMHWSMSEKLDFSASVVNLGSITWNKKTTVNPIADDDIEFPTRFLDDFGAETVEFVERLGRDHPVDTSYRTALPTMAYLSGSYFITPTTSVTALLNPRLFDGQFDLGFSVGIGTRINKILEVNANLSSYNRSTINFGLGASANLGPVQLFVVTDNVLAALAFKTSRNVHLNAGLNVCFGRQTRDERTAELLGKEEKKEEKLAENTPSPKAKPTLKPGTSNLLPTVSMIGAVFNALNREQLSGVMFEMISVKPDGEEQSTLKRTFADGIISITLQRDQRYRLIVRKNGYEPEEVTISPDEMAGLNTLKKEFFLNGGNPTPPRPVEPVVVQSPPSTSKDRLPPTIREEENDTATKNAPNSSGKRVIVYRVLSSSYIKAGPGEHFDSLLPVVKGHRLELLDQRKGDWLLVRFRDYVGYLPANLLELEE